MKMPAPTRERLRSPFALLLLMSIAMQLGFAAWTGVVYNFAEAEGGLNGADIGLQQTIREIPGFLSFAAVFFLLVFREQTFALVSLTLLGLGVAITGYFPSLTGLLITTFIMSLGFHYYETVNQSLQMQWLPKQTAPRQLGVLLAAGSVGQLVVFVLIILLWEWMNWSYRDLFLFFGVVTLALVAFMAVWFPRFPDGVLQHKKLILRKRYWLYYLLTFFSGARRQIFVVFAAWMMIERFGYEVHQVSILFLINVGFNMLFAPYIGGLIGRFGERAALSFEYVGLILVFVAYAFVWDPIFGAALYVIDHFFFALAIAMKTYFQKIADPADFAPTASVAFTINHIAAVIIPVTFGLLWLVSPAAVFLAGAAMAACSLAAAQLIPRLPAPGNETTLSARIAKPAE